MSSYEEFRERENGILHEPESPAGIRPTTIDTDGSTLYEKQFFPLRTAIIERNDTAALKKYLENAPWAIKRGHALGMYYDPFIVAARHESIDALKMLLDHYSNFMKPSGRTDLDGRCCRVLNTAAQCGRLEAVKLLLDHPLLDADIHYKYNGFTPIMAATNTFDWKDNIEGKKAVIDWLLDRGARASDVEYSWDSFLDPITGKYIAKQVPFFTVLNLAAGWAGADLTQRLIKSGADPDIKLREYTEVTSRVDITIISTASRYANVDALTILLDCANRAGHVADTVSYRDSWGNMALHWACRVSIEEDPREVAEKIMAEKVQRIITILGLLLDCNPETINSQDIYGNTPLHYAAMNYSNYGHEYTAIFQYICDRGADASIRNKKSETALHSLCSYDGGLPIDTAAIEILFGHGAKVTDTDDNGNTPLHSAVKNLENLDAIEFLLDHGADIGAKNLKGNTPLHEAANGMFWPGVMKEKYKSMGDILRKLQGDEGCLVDKLNVEGKSARQILNEVRKDFQQKMDDIENERKVWESEIWKK
ncbi:Ankyrin-1 [Fusarium oxysporum f. sp. cubense race 1]|uniref:Ankyrin-1 n=1 Tax=Fusarium oxysporum f. sp. cubense (strain race 1) TaxID=1229664 RepID=N4UMR9_FUSC1|nr:Ankyrin-1 [Fusarium oxysporum f. sp. cubense race 1]